MDFRNLKDLQINLEQDIELTLISEQIGKTKPATLFFISKFGCEVDKIIFYNKNTMENIWEEFDVLVAASPKLLSNNSNKPTIKYETSYNSNINIEDTITNLKELESKLKKIIKND